MHGDAPKKVMPNGYTRYGCWRCDRTIAYETTTKGVVLSVHPFTVVAHHPVCAPCFHIWYPNEAFKPVPAGVLATPESAMDTMEETADGGYSDMASEVTYQHHDEVTIFTRLQRAGIVGTEYAVDVLLAHAEAERQINEWLDILRRKRVAKVIKDDIRRRLAASHEEYLWLIERRKEIEDALQLDI